jgi:hypothetical protein
VTRRHGIATVIKDLADEQRAALGLLTGRAVEVLVELRLNGFE